VSLWMSALLIGFMIMWGEMAFWGGPGHHLPWSRAGRYFYFRIAIERTSLWIAINALKLYCQILHFRCQVCCGALFLAGYFFQHVPLSRYFLQKLFCRHHKASKSQDFATSTKYLPCLYNPGCSGFFGPITHIRAHRCPSVAFFLQSPKRIPWAKGRSDE